MYLLKLVRQKFSSLRELLLLIDVQVFLEWICPQSGSTYWTTTIITNKLVFFCELCRLSAEAHRHEICRCNSQRCSVNNYHNNHAQAIRLSPESELKHFFTGTILKV